MKEILYDADPTLKVGDLVLNLYSKHDCNIWEISKIDRRFLTETDCKVYSLYKEYEPGEEYNPLITIVKVYDDKYCKVKSKNTKSYDASFVKKLDTVLIQNIIDELKLKINNIQKVLKYYEQQNT